MKHYVISYNPSNEYKGPFLIKSEKGELFGDHFIYNYLLNIWINDNLMITNDHIICYDPGEEYPYKTGNTSIMEEMKEIREEEALDIIKNNKCKFSILLYSKYRKIINDYLLNINK